MVHIQNEANLQEEEEEEEVNTHTTTNTCHGDGHRNDFVWVGRLSMNSMLNLLLFSLVPFEL